LHFTHRQLGVGVRDANVGTECQLHATAELAIAGWKQAKRYISARCCPTLRGIRCSVCDVTRSVKTLSHQIAHCKN
jgi:hypothetical protein